MTTRIEFVAINDAFCYCTLCEALVRKNGIQRHADWHDAELQHKHGRIRGKAYLEMKDHA